MKRATEAEVAGARGRSEELRRIAGVVGREHQVRGEWIQVATNGREGRRRRWELGWKGGQGGSHR